MDRTGASNWVFQRNRGYKWWLQPTAISRNQGERTHLRSSEVSFCDVLSPHSQEKGGARIKEAVQGLGLGVFLGKMENRGAKQLELWEEVVGGGKGIFFFFLVVLYDLRYLPLPGIEPMFSAVEAWNPNH